MDMTRLFVYGTLKRGGQLNYAIKNHATFIGDYKTAPIFQLVDLGSFPGLIDGEIEVKGEVWEIPTDLLGLIDSIEGAPILYSREIIEVKNINGEENSEVAWTYIFNNSEKPMYRISEFGEKGLDFWPTRPFQREEVF